MAALVLFLAGVTLAVKVFPSNARTFYCGGRTVAEHRDPYLVEPLRSCEHAIVPHPGFDLNEVEPAPLPPFILAGLSVWARLPYGTAHVVWCAVLVGSVVVAALALARLTGFPTLYVLLALSFVDGLMNVGFGDVTPICVALLCVAAVAAERKAYRTSAIAAAAAMIEPHVALPACIALFIFAPATRIWLLSCAALLILASISALGSGESFEYFKAVLPAQALAEVSAPDQYSLTWLLHRIGASDSTALRFGTLSYLFMGVAGVALARRLALIYEYESFIVLFAPAAVLLGGTFIHDIQMGAAMPAALLLASRARQLRGAIWATAILLAFPLFLGREHISGMVVASAATCGVALMATRRSPVAVRLLLCLALAGSVVAFDRSQRSASTIAQPPLRLPAGQPNESASLQWARYIDATAERGPWSWQDSLKFPVWLALGGLVAGGLAQLGPSPASRRSTPLHE